jgi:hypothetical protein
MLRQFLCCRRYALGGGNSAERSWREVSTPIPFDFVHLLIHFARNYESDCCAHEP